MKALIESIGFAGALTTAWIVLPQAVRAVRVGTDGISPATFQLLVAVSVMWLVYGVSEHYLPAWPGNSCQLVTSTIVLIQCRRHGHSWNDVMSIAVALVVITGVVFVAAGGVWIGWCAVLVSLGLRVPQIRAAMISEKLSGISVSTWWVSVASNLLWLIYGIAHTDPRLIVATTVNILGSVAIIAVVARRRASRLLLGDPGAPLVVSSGPR